MGTVRVAMGNPELIRRQTRGASLEQARDPQFLDLVGGNVLLRLRTTQIAFVERSLVFAVSSRLHHQAQTIIRPKHGGLSDSDRALPITRRSYYRMHFPTRNQAETRWKTGFPFFAQLFRSELHAPPQ